MCSFPYSFITAFTSFHSFYTSLFFVQFERCTLDVFRYSILLALSGPRCTSSRGLSGTRRAARRPIASGESTTSMTTAMPRRRSTLASSTFGLRWPTPSEEARGTGPRSSASRWPLRIAIEQGKDQRLQVHCDCREAWTSI